MYDRYQERMEDKDSKLRAKKARTGYENDEWDGFSEDNKSDDSDNEEEGDSQVAPPTEKAPETSSLSNNASLFFDQDIFQGLGDEEEEEMSAQEIRQPKEVEPPLEIYVQRTEKVTEENGTTTTSKVFSITQEGDPNTTHKLQMPGGTATFKPLGSDAQPTQADSSVSAKEDKNHDQERIEIIKSDLQNETVSSNPPILESVEGVATDSD